MVGILIHGNNHYILSGPAPTESEALVLARHWGLIQIGQQKPLTLSAWQIREKEFRENLEWAVVVPGDREPSDGAVQLLEEMIARGIRIQRCEKGCW